MSHVVEHRWAYPQLNLLKKKAKQIALATSYKKISFNLSFSLFLLLSLPFSYFSFSFSVSFSFSRPFIGLLNLSQSLSLSFSFLTLSFAFSATHARITCDDLAWHTRVDTQQQNMFQNTFLVHTCAWCVVLPV